MPREPTERDLIQRLAKASPNHTIDLREDRWGKIVRKYGKHHAAGYFTILGQRIRLTRRGHG